MPPRSDPWNPLCCEYLLFHAKRRDKQPPHTGSTIHSMRSAVKSDGQPLESAWPYSNALPVDLEPLEATRQYHSAFLPVLASGRHGL